MKTTIIIPTLNELECLKTTLPQIKRSWYDQLIVLDGQSSDGTLEWCKEQGYPTFTQREPGLWNAFRELFQANVILGDVVITLSPDGNCIPSAIQLLLWHIADHDMVIASRYTNGARSEDDNILTAFGNHLLTGLVNFRSNYQYTDALNMFRAYRVNIISQLDFLTELTQLQKWLARHTTLFSFEPSLSIRATHAKLRIAEIGASEPKAMRARRQNTFIHGFTILTQIIYEKWFRRQ